MVMENELLKHLKGGGGRGERDRNVANRADHNSYSIKPMLSDHIKQRRHNVLHFRLVVAYCCMKVV